MPTPVILTGDFNAYNTMWGSEVTDSRGQIIENVIATNELNVINNGAPTRVAYNVETAIDI